MDDQSGARTSPLARIESTVWPSLIPVARLWLAFYSLESPFVVIAAKLATAA